MISPLHSLVTLYSLHFHPLRSLCQTLTSFPLPLLFHPNHLLFPYLHCIPSSVLSCRRLHLPLVTMRYQYCKENHWRLLMFNHSHKFYIPLIHLHGIHTHTHTLALSLKTIERWTQIVHMHKRKEHPNTTFGKHTQTNASVHTSAYWNTHTHTSKHTDSGTHP